MKIVAEMDDQMVKAMNNGIEAINCQRWKRRREVQMGEAYSAANLYTFLKTYNMNLVLHS